MSKVYIMVGLLLGMLVAVSARAEAFKLNNGETLNGEVLPTTANDQGVQVKVGEGDYQRVPWGSFSQEDLKKFEKNQKMQPFVEPFIEPDPQLRIKKTQVNIKEPPRLEIPAKQSLLGAMFSSSVGLFILVMIYGAGVYAGYEVAVFRAQPPALVAGLSAIPGLGLLAPLVFLVLPTKMKAAPEIAEPALADNGEAAPARAVVADDVNPMQAEGAPHPGGLRLAHSETDEKPALPETITFKRGQFTFNRRFFETKFPGFFGVVRRDADKDMVLVVKSSRGEYAGQRISRIAANDLHLQVPRGQASEEVQIPFQEIQEIRLKHKDATA